MAVLNAGIRTTSQPTYNVGWDVATAKSEQSEHGDDNNVLYTTPVLQPRLTLHLEPAYSDLQVIGVFSLVLNG